MQTPRLRRLLEKYELLVCLTQSAPGRTPRRRDDMRLVAQRFPAALREWEQQPAAEIDRRRRLVAAALARREAQPAAERSAEAAEEAPQEVEVEDWLRYGLDLHDCLRAVLQLRSYLSQRGEGQAELAACQGLVRDCEVPWLAVTPELLGAIAAPARGRLAAIAYEAVARRHGSSAAAIKAAVFGPGSGRAGRAGGAVDPDHEGGGAAALR